MATKKRKAKQTLREFRAWLDGVEELQPEEWCPSADQWQLIRNKIDGIKDEPVKVIEAAANNGMATPQQSYNQQPYPNDLGIPPPPMPTSSIPNGPVTISPAANELFSADPTTGRTKTPHSKANDPSSFV